MGNLDHHAVDEWFADRLTEQAAAHSGVVLGDLVRALSLRLPPGPLDFVSTSDEGCALAAVAASSRADASTWGRLDFARPLVVSRGHRTVVVEAVRLGEGLRAAMRAYAPDALIFDLTDMSTSAVAAAA